MKTNKDIMNYKLEKFWNEGMKIFANLLGAMNYKLEKFWNSSLFVTIASHLDEL